MPLNALVAKLVVRTLPGVGHVLCSTPNADNPQAGIKSRDEASVYADRLGFVLMNKRCDLPLHAPILTKDDSTGEYFVYVDTVDNPEEAIDRAKRLLETIHATPA